MKGIILAAGKGTRLKNLTDNKPKALVKVNGVPMLELVIKKMAKSGIKTIMINIHHHGEMIIDFLRKNNNFGLNISISDERNELLNTGGAILKMKDFIAGNDPILIHNVDIISDVDFHKLLQHHTNTRSIASLCTRNRNTNRGLLIDSNSTLCGWTNSATNEFKWVDKPVEDYTKTAFSGIYIISPDFPEKISFSGYFSIIDAWLNIAKENTITCFHDDSQSWHDLGTIEKILEAERKKNG